MDAPGFARIKSALDKAKKKYSEPSDHTLRYLAHNGKTFVAPSDSGYHGDIAIKTGLTDKWVGDRTRTGYITHRDVRPIKKLGIAKWVELRHRHAADPQHSQYNPEFSSGVYIPNPLDKR